jgi:hypothetical protein
MCAIDHALASAMGSVDTSAFPAPSTATHNERDGHDTEFRLFVPSTRVTDHAEGPPVGSVDVAMPPASSTATHRSTDGHEMLQSAPASSTCTILHSDAPPVGCVDVTTSPAWSTATHKSEDGHEIPASPFGATLAPAAQDNQLDARADAHAGDARATTNNNTAARKHLIHDVQVTKRSTS